MATLVPEVFREIILSVTESGGGGGGGEGEGGALKRRKIPRKIYGTRVPA